MSKNKFRLLASFMIITFIITICFTAFELGSYFHKKNLVTTENDKKESMIEKTDEKDASTILKPNEKTARVDEKKVEKEISEETQRNTTKETKISLVFAGDVLLTDSLLNQYKNKGSDITSILQQSVLDELENGDITMINQEFPFSIRGIQMADKQYTFKADPKYVKVLLQMGIDIVSLANNHTLDFGVEALLDTILTLDNANIKHVGAGENLNKAKTTEYSNINQSTIAFLGASRVIPVYSWNAGEKNAGLFTTYDPQMLLEEIKIAKEKSDFVVVYVHWGIEKKEFPEEYQRDLAKQYIDAGADLIIGSHPHVLQGIEFYKEKPIIYSMGNFVFGNSTFETMILKVQITNKEKIQLKIVPCETKNGYTTKMTTIDKMTQFYNYIESISYYTNIDKQGNVLQKHKE